MYHWCPNLEPLLFFSMPRKVQSCVILVTIVVFWFWSNGTVISKLTRDNIGEKFSLSTTLFPRCRVGPTPRLMPMGTLLPSLEILRVGIAAMENWSPLVCGMVFNLQSLLLLRYPSMEL